MAKEERRRKRREYAKRWRLANLDHYRASARQNNMKRYHEKMAIIRKHKRKQGCKRCPENDPVCLDFHHRDPATKSFAVSKGYAHYSIERLFLEIAKCDLLCANCHRKLEARKRKRARAG